MRGMSISNEGEIWMRGSKSMRGMSISDEGDVCMRRKVRK